MEENKPKFIKVGDAIYLDPEGKQGNNNNQKTQQEQKPPAFSVKGIGEPEKEAPISGAGGYFSSQVSVKDIVPVDIKSLPAVIQQSIRRVLQYPEGTDIDPRQIRALTPSDIVTIANQIARDADLHGQVDVLTYPGPSSGQLPASLTPSGNLKVAVLEGGAGGGLAQIQVRDSSNIWTDIGYYTGNLNLPVQIQNSLPAGSNTIGNVGVNNFPSEYPLPASQVSDLKNVNVGNFPTDYAKQSQLPSALTASGNLKTAILEALPSGTNKIGSVDIASALPAGTNKIGSVDVASLPSIPAGTNNIGKVDVNSLPSLPAGSNTIGNVNAIKSGTWNIDNLLNPHPVLVNRQGAITHFSVALTAAGSSTIYTPSTGKAAKVIAWSFYSDADVVVEMRFGTSGNVIAGLPAKGAHAMNLIGTEAPTGAANETIVIYGAGAVNVKGWVSIVEV
jgi:hypothetical protein